MPIYKANGKKDGLQKYNVRVNYISDSGQPKQLTRTAYGSEAAKDLERRLVAQIKGKGENPAKKMTVQQLFDEYIIAKQHEVRESTLVKDKQIFRLYLQPTLANVRIDKLTVALLQEWKLGMAQKDLSLKTKKHAYGGIRAILNYAVRLEYIPKNPLPKIGNFKEAQTIKPEMGIYTAQEFSKFISTAKRLAAERQIKNHDLSEWDYYVFFNIAFYTGLRKGDAYVKHKLKKGANIFCREKSAVPIVLIGSALPLY